MNKISKKSIINTVVTVFFLTLIIFLFINFKDTIIFCAHHQGCTSLDITFNKIFLILIFLYLTILFRNNVIFYRIFLFITIVLVLYFSYRFYFQDKFFNSSANTNGIYNRGAPCRPGEGIIC
jgi:hypothetical protein